MSFPSNSPHEDRPLNSLLRFWNSHETQLACALFLLILAVGAANENFFSLDNLFGLLRNSIVSGLMALGVLVVLISREIDVSFTAIAAFSFYTTSKLLLLWNYEGSFLLPLLIAACLGTVLGLLNASLVSLLRLPALIVTLGTLSIFRGFTLTAVGSEYLAKLPEGMIRFSKLSLFEAQGADGSMYRLPMAFLLLVAAAVLTHFILHWTWLGRGIYCLGGSSGAARRVGFNISRLYLFVFGFVGFLSGIGGIVHCSLARMANPFDLVGMELNVIAAVVLGGARLSGGHGTVVGTLLGVGLIVVIEHSLILLGIPSFWQKVVVGLLILLGTGIPLLQSKRNRKGVDFAGNH